MLLIIFTRTLIEKRAYATNFKIYQWKKSERKISLL